MKYYVTHSCGHDEMVELFGPGRERDRKIERMESEECPECRAKHATERDEAKGYAALKGSPKQVAWASDIREGMFDRMAEYIRKTIVRDLMNGETKGYTPEQLAEATVNADRIILSVFNGLRRETSAKWLIEHKSAGLLDDLAARYFA